MDSPLSALDAKGNLATAPALYNPGRIAERVVHFTPGADDTRYSALFSAWGIEIVPYLAGGGPRAFRFLRGLVRVVWKIRRERVQLIRGRLPYLGSLFGCIAGRLLGIPVVVSLGGDNRLPQEQTGRYHFKSRRVSFLVESLVLRACDVIVAPNAFTREYVAGIIGDARARAKVLIIPWRIDDLGGASASDTALTALGLDGNRPLVLVVGFLNRYKYSHVMFDVARALAGVSPEPHFVFCGDGELRDQGEAALAGCPAVRFVGWQPRPVVQALIRASSVVLVPMSGFVLLEAAAEGRAVVASAVEWHGEMVEDGLSGFLVPPTSVEDWVRRTVELLRDPGRRAAMGARLHETFLAEYSPPRALELEVDLYLRVARR